jgi:hypothetical protein
MRRGGWQVGKGTRRRQTERCLRIYIWARYLGPYVEFLINLKGPLLASPNGL